MTIIDGKRISAEVKQELKEEVDKIRENGGKIPHLAAVLIGDNGASETYVASKIKSCEQIGFKSSLIRRGSETTEAEVLEIIDSLNKDEDVDGFIVQLPLPDHINVDKVIEAIDPKKDVDGFHPINVGRMAKGLPAYISATPFGVLELLKRYKIETAGKHCVVVGRSQIVGLPMSLLMARNDYPGNCTVTLTHSRTANLKEICQQADILVAALGRPEFIKADMVKEGAVVIDVGITRVKDETKKSGFAIKGDVAFEEVAPKTSFITPVPGGVGLMTVAALMYNTLLASKKAIYS
ncbi:bifunctional methylenetetrahydrofolate dehydrogenase/methenyltetrahydrofolate cyclohydrolase FolD [Leadbetterella byssophila]|jgi:methylenetetrahydrofolate dehydrogenase (NADP+)/methenyltetrahydrofolate cyclohydrolase|uniref:Bifunctional protein FolD n=1 Tax=Leadbetterella byssophila (strain DSM 17132 / JCM 16389 / KACC 11308 / NBRC 106382 / 4M15) TaxID=649349 RepID=E4RVA6_LEAB4|nr:bifunctional methylenetetrahydrofolate dehydrogenase/methenyltetrahydrofolate cyclohydrolase FolD [Leadbetterella byssophila]ADQ18844.1 5,10-methylenetetrahydrofolate dehydrogenase (NADP+); methenyltetrahydrofolate cyclohydrolase [Leadbetterella byssophila DSM 17132]